MKNRSLTELAMKKNKSKTLPENRSTIIVVFGAILHETKSINITDKGFALSTEQIKSTDILLERWRSDGLYSPILLLL